MPVQFDDFLKLVLPCDDNGKFDGPAKVVKQIPDGFDARPWFVSDDKRVMHFKIPAQGATTSNSKSPRCELTGFHFAPANGRQDFYMARTVWEICKDNNGNMSDVVICQVRAIGKEMVRFHIGEGSGDQAKLWLVDELRDPNPTFDNDDTLTLGEKFKVWISVHTRSVSVDVEQALSTGLKEWHARWTLDEQWQKATDAEFVFGLYGTHEKPGSGYSTSKCHRYTTTVPRL